MFAIMCGAPLLHCWVTMAFGPLGELVGWVCSLPGIHTVIDVHGTYNAPVRYSASLNVSPKTLILLKCQEIKEYKYHS